MNWDAVGAIGEIVSAIAVFGTLLFLAVQIRQSNRVSKENTRLSIAEMRHRSNQSIGDWSNLLLANPDLETLWSKGCSGELVSGEEKARFFRLARNFFGIHATSYYDYDSIHDDRAKHRMVEFVVNRITDSQGLREVWVDLEDTPFTNYAEFWDDVNQSLSEAGT